MWIRIRIRNSAFPTNRSPKNSGTVHCLFRGRFEVSQKELKECLSSALPDFFIKQECGVLSALTARNFIYLFLLRSLKLNWKACRRVPSLCLDLSIIVEFYLKFTSWPCSYKLNPSSLHFLNFVRFVIFVFPKHYARSLTQVSHTASLTLGWYFGRITQMGSVKICGDLILWTNLDRNCSYKGSKCPKSSKSVLLSLFLSYEGKFFFQLSVFFALPKLFPKVEDFGWMAAKSCNTVVGVGARPP